MIDANARTREIIKQLRARRHEAGLRIELIGDPFLPPISGEEPFQRKERINLIQSKIEAGLDYQSIGRELGITRERVRQIAAKHHLGGGHQARTERRNAIIAAIADGMSVDDAASRFGLSRATTQSYTRTARAELKRSELAPLIQQIRDGASIRKTAAGSRLIEQRLARECLRLGVISTHGPKKWRLRRSRGLENMMTGKDTP